MAQWSNTGNNYTTKLLSVGTSASSAPYWLKVNGSGTWVNHAIYGSATSTNSYAYGVLEKASACSSCSEIGVYGWAASGSGAGKLAVYARGNLAYTGGLQASSDERLKKDITDLSGGLDLVMKLRPREYSFKEPNIFSSGRQAGLIAQELNEILPHLTGMMPIPTSIDSDLDKEELYMTIDYVKLIPYLVKAIQEQKSLISSLSNSSEIL